MLNLVSDSEVIDLKNHDLGNAWRPLTLTLSPDGGEGISAGEYHASGALHVFCDDKIRLHQASPNLGRRVHRFLGFTSQYFGLVWAMFPIRR